jgi:hypothetical protein
VIKDESYDAIATILFNMIKEPEAPWILSTEVYETTTEKDAPNKARDHQEG